ncbi:MAG TPA: hypothetical protein VEX68_01570 [Bryobacteraceae bacterium]|nr:hypothetical protein [Bryobacteraceae bacterium]
MSKLALCTFLATAFFLASAEASVIAFADKAQWISAAHPTNSIDFQGLALSGQTLDVPPPGLNIAGVQLAGNLSLFPPETSLRVVSNTPAGPGGPLDPFNWDSGDILLNLSRLTITLPADVFTLSLEVGVTATLYTGMQYPMSFTAYTAEGESTFTIASPPGQSLAFWGLKSDTPITGLVLESATLQVIDNIQWTAIPEPASEILIGIGLIALTALRLAKKSTI